MERDAKIGLGSSFRTKRREAQLSLTQGAPIDSPPALVMAERCSGRTLRSRSQTAGESQRLQAERRLNFLAHHASRLRLGLLPTRRELHSAQGDDRRGFQT